jgi:hypothetical protein
VKAKIGGYQSSFSSVAVLDCTSHPNWISGLNQDSDE